MLRLSSDDQVIFITAVVCCSIAGLAVLIRFWCKTVLKVRYHADDWLILVALATYWAMAGVELWGIFASRGKLPEKAVVLSLKSTYFTHVLAYIAGLAFMLSVCFFYKQIFPSQSYRTGSTWLMALTVAWFLGGELGWTFACTPISYSWNHEQEGSCIDAGKLALAFSIIRALLLVAILLLPVRSVFTIQIPLRTKYLVSGIFLLGATSIITQILMLYYTCSPSESPYGREGFWLHIHISTAITSVCLPVYKPLSTKFAEGFSRLRNVPCSVLGRSDAQSSSKTDSTTSIPIPPKIFHRRDLTPMKFLACCSRDNKSEDSDDLEAGAGIVPRGDGAENHTTVVAEQHGFASMPPLGIGVTKQYEVV